MLSEQSYLDRFGIFFRNADFSSSYKPVFLKSIMDISDYPNDRLIGSHWLSTQDCKLVVELDFVAVRYAKYYWDMYYKFRLRQSHNPSDVNIHKFFKDSDQNPLRPPSLTDLANDEHQKLRSNVIRKSIKPEVLGKLNKDLGLYEIVKGKNYIVFNYPVVNLLRKYKGILIPAVNYALTRYLEKINFSPRIAEKVRGIPARGYLTREEKTALLQFHKNRCFYCDEEVEKIYIDHVIPFDYIFSTELFNSVPSCEKCNSEKSNRLPIKSIFAKVLERNNKLRDITTDYDQNWYLNLYKKCEVEYHGNRKYFEPQQTLMKGIG